MIEQVVQAGRRHVVAQGLQQDAVVAVGEPHLLELERPLDAGPSLRVWKGSVSAMGSRSSEQRSSKAGRLSETLRASRRHLRRKAAAASANTSPSLSAVSSHRNGRCGNCCSSIFRPLPISTTQRAGGRQVVAGLGEDAAHQIEPVGAAGVGNARLGRILGREGRQRLGADVGRIGQDEIVAPAGVRREQIRLHERDALSQAVVAHVALGDGKGIRARCRWHRQPRRETPGRPGSPGNPSPVQRSRTAPRVRDRTPDAIRRPAPPSAGTATRRCRSEAR